jgi:hypothetical protein
VKYKKCVPLSQAEVVNHFFWTYKVRNVGHRRQMEREILNGRGHGKTQKHSKQKYKNKMFGKKTAF